MHENVVFLSACRSHSNHLIIFLFDCASFINRHERSVLAMRLSLPPFKSPVQVSQTIG